MTPSEQLAAADPILAEVITATELIPLQPTGNVFHDLMSCLVEQQIHYRSTKNIFGKAMERAELTELTPGNFEQFEEHGLSKIKLSMRKSETMLGALDFWKNAPADWSALTDAEVRKTLQALPGIGPWTVDMILLHSLERPDVFPVDDYHLKKAMVRHYDLDPTVRLKPRMREIAKNWQPNRSLAVRYLLA